MDPLSTSQKFCTRFGVGGRLEQSPQKVGMEQPLTPRNHPEARENSAEKPEAQSMENDQGGPSGSRLAPDASTEPTHSTRPPLSRFTVSQTPRPENKSSGNTVPPVTLQSRPCLVAAIRSLFKPFKIPLVDLAPFLFFLQIISSPSLVRHRHSFVNQSILIPAVQKCSFLLSIFQHRFLLHSFAITHICNEQTDLSSQRDLSQFLQLPTPWPFSPRLSRWPRSLRLSRRPRPSRTSAPSSTRR
jgi:hypothetical protein